MITIKQMCTILSKLGLTTGVGILSLLYFSLVPVHAADGAQFATTPVFAVNQNPDNLDYFSLTVSPNQTVPVAVTVNNLSPDKTHRFSTELVAATTSPSGKIDYTLSNQPRNWSDKPLLPDLVAKNQRRQTYQLTPKEERTITFHLKIPPKGFSGTILGSLYTKRLTDDNPKAKNMSFQNRFAMSNPVSLSEDFNQPRFPKLSLTTVKMTNHGGLPKLTTSIHNKSPYMFGNIKLDAKLYKRNRAQILFQQSVKNYEMAPSSTLDYAMPIGTRPLLPGRYTIQVTLSSGEKKFHLQRNFTISRKEEKQIDKNMTNKARPNYVLWLIIIILVGVITALVFYTFRRKRRH